MRAKLAVTLAAFSILLGAMPGAFATQLSDDVHRILYGAEPDNFAGTTVRTQSAVVTTGTPVVVGTTPLATQTVISSSGTACSPNVSVTTVDSSPMMSHLEGTEEMVLREVPAVLAPTTTGVAIITEIPSDVDIRREDLSRRINDALAAGGLSAAQQCDLQSALGQVGTAEVQMRADGLLNYDESRKLYRAMDKIGSDLDYYTNPGSTNLLGMRVTPGVWTFPWL